MDDALRRRMEIAIKRSGVSKYELEKRGNFRPGYLGRVLREGKSVTLEFLERFAKATGEDKVWLAFGAETSTHRAPPPPPPPPPTMTTFDAALVVVSRRVSPAAIELVRQRFQDMDELEVYEWVDKLTAAQREVEEGFMPRRGRVKTH